MFASTKLRSSYLAVLGVVAAAGAAAAQPRPRAVCPDAESPEAAPSQEPSPPVAQAEPVPEPQPPEPQPQQQPPPVAQQPPAPPPTTYQQQQPMYQQQPPMAEPYEVAEEDETLERYGIAVSLGGGVSGFTDDTMRDTTDDGGAWGVRVAFGTRSPIGLEAEYFGSAQGIDAFGIDDDALLIGNGVQAVARVNLLDYTVQPFVFGGVAWRHYNLADEGINTSAVNDEDDVLEIPLGVGIAWKYRGLMLDARGEFRAATEQDLVPSLNRPGKDAEMHRYGVTANVGFAF